MSNDLMPLEEKLERALHGLGEALEAAGEARANAENLDERRKQKRAVLFIKYKSKGESAATAEQMAMADPEYEEAVAEWTVANLAYRRLDAQAEKRRLGFECWRTISANRRAEANLR
jgi:hypothetical protein